VANPADYKGRWAVGLKKIGELISKKRQTIGFLQVTIIAWLMASLKPLFLKK
jgi:hypothetical protein